jgi:hypothetical protein
MAQWNDIRQFARTNYPLSNDEPEWFGIIFTISPGRTQKVVVRPYRAYDRDWIEFRSAVCRQDEMSPVVALRQNAEMAMGFLALIGERYYVLHNAPLATLDVEEFKLPLQFLAMHADKLEGQYSSGSDDY